MIAPATPRQRLILAATVAFFLDFVLSFASTRLLPTHLLTLAVHGNSFIQPMSCVIVAVSLFCGGWVGGRRFLPIGVALVLLMQVLSLVLLVQLAHGIMPQRPLMLVLKSVLSSNLLGLGLQLLAGALGAAAGAAVHRRRPFPPLSAQESL